MSHYKPYPAYKDSGVEWLGSVPEHWATKKLLYWISGYGSGTTPSSEDEYSTDGLPWVTTGELRENTVFSTEKRVTHDALKNNSALKLHPAGSLVIAMYGATVGRLGVLGIDATLNQACFAIHPSERIRIPFLRHWFEGFRSELVGLATGAGQPNISGDKIRNLLLPCPQDLSEQAAIIAHLDRETARIDALIEKKTRFIELLREKRQALITHAVTKGLAPNVKMKDSGVEWLGEVPEHWGVRSFKHLAGIRYGIGEPPAYKAEGTPLIRATNVDAGCIRSEGLVYVDPADIPDKRIIWLAPGDIIVVRSGAYTGDSAIVQEHHCPAIAGFDMVVSPKCVNPFFLQYALLSRYLKSNQIDLEKMRAAQPHLNAEELGSCFVLLPPPIEQESIVAFLDHSTKRVDGIISKTLLSIDLLKERRSALITAAVTGQIDLRETV